MFFDHRALAAVAFAAACVSSCESVPNASRVDFSETSSGGLFTNYRGEPEVIRSALTETDDARSVQGIVFEDMNQNGKRDANERGLAGVKVSNGADVVVTAPDGTYTLPVRDDMAVMVIQPSGYQVPHNDKWVPQFSYQHKPSGSAKRLRFGGIPATGLLPEAINFPLISVRSNSDQLRCIVLGDIQTYSNQEIGYVRDSTIDDLHDRGAEARGDCILAVGDVVGDDLRLIPRVAELLGTLKTPQWWVHGNHDIDFDADSDADSSDTWRHIHGPNYYAFEIGQTLFIVLDNVVYPCGAEDARMEGRAFCVTEPRKRYNGRIPDEQMQFVENLLAHTDEDKLIVFAHHIPFVTFYDQDTSPHQTDNVTELYALAEGREALSISGHTHTTEVLEAGDRFSGWEERVGVTALPFRHIIAGAASGSWFQGDLSHDGTPMALQRMGAPKGWLRLDVQGTAYQETYHGANMGRERRMWTSVNTPVFRSWFNQITSWLKLPAEERDPTPPLSINDLPDVQTITPRDLARGTFITANIWDGASSTQAHIKIGDTVLDMERTQNARGEQVNIGPEWADPYAAQRQLSVTRVALESRSGMAANQGVQIFRGQRIGPAVPQPQSAIADRNIHLWRARLPETLPLGSHLVEVEAVDRHGRQLRDTLLLEIRETLPSARARTELFETIPDGPPLR